MYYSTLPPYLDLDKRLESIIKAVLADLPVEKYVEARVYDEEGQKEKNENIGYNSCLDEIKKKWRIK